MLGSGVVRDRVVGAKFAGACDEGAGVAGVDVEGSDML
jgi:hypothetical protein